MKQIGFIANQDGAVVKYDPRIHAVREPAQPPGPLTRHQRATLYFKALRAASALLREVGFQTVADVGHSGFCIEMDRFILEMMVKEAPRLAYVTSYPGYVYDPQNVTARVEMASCPTDSNDYVIQVVASYPRGTFAPRYVMIRQNSPDVLREAFMGILAVARTFISKDPHLMAKIQAALARRDLEKDLDRLSREDARQLPPMV